MRKRVPEDYLYFFIFKVRILGVSMGYGREEGIRTLDELPHTRVPVVRLRPLGHLSIIVFLKISKANLSIHLTKASPLAQVIVMIVV